MKMTKNYNLNFSWIVNRLKFKYKENVDIINNIQQFNSEYIHIKKNINKHTIDNLCQKYYPDFHIMKCEGMSIGYTIKEQNKIRDMIKGIINSIAEMED